MERIEKGFMWAIDNDKKYPYLSFSLGKDSTVVAMLCKLCYKLGSIPELPYLVFSNTKVELKAQNKFLNYIIDSDWYPKEKIIIIEPNETFVSCIKKYGKPLESKIKDQFIETYQNFLKQGNELPTLQDIESDKKIMTRLLLLGKSNYNSERSTSRFQISNRDMHILHKDFDIKVSSHCCDELKKKPFEKYALDNDMWVYFDGEMASEGGIRESQYQKRISEKNAKACTTIKEIGSGKDKREMKKIMPIIDWSSSVEEEFIDKYNVPLSEAYTKYGCKRTGCCMCVYGGSIKDLEERLKILWDFEPKMYKFAMATMKDVYIARNIKCHYDLEYEKERVETWVQKYYQMRYEMIAMYRPNKKDKYKVEKFINKIDKCKKVNKVHKIEKDFYEKMNLFYFLDEGDE